MVQGVGFQAALVWKVDFFFFFKFPTSYEREIEIKNRKEKGTDRED